MPKAEEMISGVDFKGHARKVAAILGKYYPALLEQAYSDVGGKLPVAPSFELHNPKVQDTIKSLAQRVKGISDTTRDDIQGVVSRALDEPKIPSTQEIGKRLREAGVTDSVSRANTISRTETAHAYNHGAISAYSDAGVDKVECLDSDNDPECAARNGQIMTLDEAMAIEPHPNCVLAFLPVVDSIEKPIDHILDDATPELIDAEQALTDRGVTVQYGGRDGNGVVDLPSAEDALTVMRAHSAALDVYDTQGIKIGARYMDNGTDREVAFGSNLKIVADPSRANTLAEAHGSQVYFNTSSIDAMAERYAAAVRDYSEGRYPEFASTSVQDTIIHELAHTVEHGATKTEMNEWIDLFNNTSTTRNTSPSAYGTENQAEAFAESVTRILGDHPDTQVTFEGPLRDKAEAMLKSFADRLKEP